MSLLAVCMGAFLLGWVLPELALVVGGRTDIAKMPFGINLFCSFGLSMVAYGVNA